MKKIFLLSAALFASLSTSCSSGTSAEEPEDTFDAAVVCPAEGLNAYGEPMRGTFTDARDSLVYKYTTIGNQVWMAENLKFDAPYSVCYNGIEGFCDTFGRFYSLHVDGKTLELFDQQLLDTICPADWHVPSADEWDILAVNVGLITRLYNGYNFGEYYKPGTDDCGFNSLPAGTLNQGDKSLMSENIVSVYWTSTARDLQTSYVAYLNSSGLSLSMNMPKMTIRCVKN